MYKLLFCIFILSPVLVFGQYESASINMFVSATSGLNIRELPSIESKVIRKLEFGQRIGLDGRTIEKHTIDGLTDYWYYTYIGNTRGWLFGGYLTDRFESAPIVGFWAEEDNLRIEWRFTIHGNIVIGLKDSGHGEWGTYELIEYSNVYFILNYYRDEELITHRMNGAFEFINNDRIKLIINDRIIILIRDNSR